MNVKHLICKFRFIYCFVWNKCRGEKKRLWLLSPHCASFTAWVTNLSQQCCQWFPRTINKYTEIYAPATWLLQPQNTFTSYLIVIANTLPDACPKALNLSTSVYNVTMNAEKWRKNPLDSSFPVVICYIDIKHTCNKTPCLHCVWIRYSIALQLSNVKKKNKKLHRLWFRHRRDEIWAENDFMLASALFYARRIALKTKQSSRFQVMWHLIACAACTGSGAAPQEQTTPQSRLAGIIGRDSFNIPSLVD